MTSNDFPKARCRKAQTRSNGNCRLSFPRRSVRAFRPRQQLSSSLIVFLQRVPRCVEEHGFKCDEAEIQPAGTYTSVYRGSLTCERDCSGHEHVAVKLVVPIMDFNQHVECIHISGQSCEVQCRRPKSSLRMKKINRRPPNRCDRHSNRE